MSFTNNSLIVPYSLTGLSTYNGINPVGSITVTGQTAYLSAAPVNNAGNITLTLGIPDASGSVTGLLTSADWNTFNGKESSLIFTSPLNRTTNTISIPQSSGSISGYVSNTDWTTFNNKQDALPVILSSLYQTNNFIGYLSGNTTLTGTRNCCYGTLSGYNLTTGSNNLLIGFGTGQVITTGNNNILVGEGYSTTSGNDNIAIGYRNSVASPYTISGSKVIGYDNTINHASCNVIGNSLTTMAGNSSYFNNIRNLSNSMMLGYNTTTKEITYETKPTSSTYTGTLPIQITGNVISCGDGYTSLYIGQNAGLTAGRANNRNNTAIGYNALKNDTTGNYNTAIGYNSMYNGVITGSANTSIGDFSAYNLTSGTYNMSFGESANESINTGNHNISMGWASNIGYNKSACVSIGVFTNYHQYDNCLHIKASITTSGTPQCNGAGQWMGPSPWTNSTGGYYVSTGFGPSNNLIGYYYSSYLSDVRTKSDIVDADISYYLDLVNQMRVRNFKYNDGKNNMNVGLITQEMETNNNLRFLIDENEGYTFDINNFFKFDNITMMVKTPKMTTPGHIKPINLDEKEVEKEVNYLKIYINTINYKLIKGDYIRYSRDRDTKDIDFIEMEAEILECENDYIVIENTDHIGIDDIGHNDSDLTTIFIEGKWVKDIKLIKKDAMAFVILPAVQQLSKENDDLKTRISKLEARLEHHLSVS
jgi:hypothetical protein